MENKRYERTARLAEAPEMTAREADEAFAVCVETVKRNMHTLAAPSRRQPV